MFRVVLHGRVANREVKFVSGDLASYASAQSIANDLIHGSNWHHVEIQENCGGVGWVTARREEPEVYPNYLDH